MGKIYLKHYASRQAQQGFSLVELVVVIVLLATLSITVAPKFLDSQGFSEYSLQKRMITALRNIQLKAMHDTRADFCHRMVFVTNASLGAEFGPSTDSYLNGEQATSCGTSVDLQSSDYLRSETNELFDLGIGFSAFDNVTVTNFIEFDSLGRPISSVERCSQGCVINFIGESTVSICIESEGYIYAC